ncbi:MAG: hypothetical protein IPP73_10185 [Chitinophagaceae bacterium]|nr:hypothetical protein [Chitinophagaceae bacterium]
MENLKLIVNGIDKFHFTRLFGPIITDPAYFMQEQNMGCILDYDDGTNWKISIEPSGSSHYRYDHKGQ